MDDKNAMMEGPRKKPYETFPFLDIYCPEGPDLDLNSLRNQLKTNELKRSIAAREGDLVYNLGHSE